MRILFSCLIVTFLLALLVFSLEPYSWTTNDYEAALDKKLVAQASVPSPRVLLCGGSNTAFGINSTQLGNYFRRPFYNLSVVAWVGIPNNLIQLANIARKNDIIILSFEYDYLRTTPPHQALLSIKAPKYSKVQLSTINDYIQFYHSRFLIIFDGLINLHIFRKPAYNELLRADGFNSVGDLTTHLESVDRYTYRKGLMQTVSLRLIDTELKTFLDIMKDRGVQVYFLPPSLCNSAYQSHKDSVDGFQKQWGEYGVKSLCKPSDMVFADSLFFDTRYHLNAKGRVLRTDFVQKALEPILAKY